MRATQTNLLEVGSRSNLGVNPRIGWQTYGIHDAAEQLFCISVPFKLESDRLRAFILSSPGCDLIDCVGVG